jgi:murein DD-endopeptidase MepM/ murein hydrolase activator NlpD
MGLPTTGQGDTSGRRPNRPAADTATAQRGHIAAASATSGDASVRVVAVRLAARGWAARSCRLYNGIDLPAPAGALVHAAAGTIEMVKRQGLGGVTVHLRHPGGLETLYVHLGNLVPAIAEGRRTTGCGFRRESAGVAIAV